MCAQLFHLFNNETTKINYQFLNGMEIFLYGPLKYKLFLKV